MIDAVHGDFSTHHFYELFGNGKTKAGSLDISVIRFVYPLEGAEEIVQTFFADAHAGVFHTDAQKDLVRRDAFALGA